MTDINYFVAVENTSTDIAEPAKGFTDIVEACNFAHSKKLELEQLGDKKGTVELYELQETKGTIAEREIIDSAVDSLMEDIEPSLLIE